VKSKFWAYSTIERGGDSLRELLNESTEARNSRQETGSRRKEEEGRSQKKCFYKLYEILPSLRVSKTLMPISMNSSVKSSPGDIS
jgi:hypothetical protein